jgi:hypothetical protein
VVSDLTTGLRVAVGDRLTSFIATRDAAFAELADSPSWSSLSEERQREILGQTGFADYSRPAIGTTTELLATLDAWPIADWQVRTDAIAEQATKAHELAARVAARDAVLVKPARAVIHDESELDAYLGDLRSKISAHLESGDTVVI